MKSDVRTPLIKKTMHTTLATLYPIYRGYLYQHLIPRVKGHPSYGPPSTITAYMDVSSAIRKLTINPYDLDSISPETLAGVCWIANCGISEVVNNQEEIDEDKQAGEIDLLREIIRRTWPKIMMYNTPAPEPHS